ncbi:Uncharacterised protein [Photobacterium damselae]|nr:Uncharacterised protein [Photobacterium damselae]
MVNPCPHRLNDKLSWQGLLDEPDNAQIISNHLILKYYTGALSEITLPSLMVIIRLVRFAKALS